ncbi:type II toxin-antitoxin system RnlB family antitoxin (plasmid) [Carnobacterium viridans]|uniref:type II toxin-antitoxin system RnlB family antitoxin n=1 Tax=Carnobacterium viridans TaxID=174587 RepID=UPI001CFF812B|nr:type II toxin-antitoxin system RnlB family antitoxin [Carnobacterium viridans]UDE96351.1 type II toxin-antitoxin system RnlB family antitoxin [Carnobacterium viridans]
MKMYKIIKPTTRIDNYQCIVMATSYTDPLEQMDLIRNLENDLRDLKISKGTVVFDLLTCIGDNFERFSTLCFDGYKFNLNSYEIINVPKKVFSVKI